ncbi:glycoside hydrolase family 2 protein [Thermothielavioides terrestris NRRL 8126]|uniref:Glycoside hydrolase family 2 protein n=1 Tax=Thermothielavioides terrestris (strain ATCC 38088 / NRRL 8126) TaxID=578455 RepID=G2RG83_THETT|nr:glycoside hydrolase family 2 protein [Thermothielavioides terrestris NRRL 8126]AEO71826.1 glycoside hydrolase family 2 protein [Thermothielavioides terrestris NRRL 8126]
MLFPVSSLLLLAIAGSASAATPGRDRSSLNADWRFSRFTSNPDSLSYNTLRSWILPQANDFLVDGAKHTAPSGTAPGSNVAYVQANFNDAGWQSLDLPHDWAIAGPWNAPGISGGMGRLPTNGVGWYRKNLTATASDVDGTKSIFLDFDGAMSYAAVWLNGNLVGGWPYGYASFRLDLTPYLKEGNNILAVRLDNAVENSRWYPGAGIYRNVWLVKVDKTHVAQYGTQITTPSVSSSSATVNVVVQVENLGNATRQVDVTTDIYEIDQSTNTVASGAAAVASIKPTTISVGAGKKQAVNGSTAVANPRLWGPPPAQTPNLYVAVTTLSATGANGTKTVIDTYETRFGIRSIAYDPSKGLLVNGQHVYVQGVCNHLDQGAIGTAFNFRATQRQLQTLQEMGANALRTSHNPPAPELLDLADTMGFLVLDEAFDCWSSGKVTNDYHLLYSDWHEADLRAFIRRDRNHPSVIAWSIGNEVSEQSSSQGGSLGQQLQNIAHSEDPTRQCTTAMNAAGPTAALPGVIDIIGLNYEGETGAYGSFHSRFPNKMIWGTETASCISSRGTYLFPVTSANSAVYSTSGGADGTHHYLSAYELFTPGWGSSPDGVFAGQDRYPFVAGEFVWTGFDYIGEPTPYGGSGGARSSYFGIVDLAGFRKDRFYLYQARWRPDLPSAHILPHWTWPDRVGQTTPVHVFSAADEVELFVNGASAGRLKRPNASTYRFRWDSVKYAPGSLRAVAYKDGKQWAVDERRTAGDAAALNVTVDRAAIAGDGKDLAYVSVAVVDANGTVVPRASNEVTFSVSGPGQLVATDNGDPTDYTAFPSAARKAFSGLAMGIVRAQKGQTGQVTVTAKADGLAQGQVTITLN